MDHAADTDPSESSDSDPPSTSPDEREQSERGSAAWTKALRDVAPYLDLGWRLAGTAAFPPILGTALDMWLGMTPWGLLTGCVVGLSGAIVQLWRLQSKFNS